jgi:hypothetical protein
VMKEPGSWTLEFRKRGRAECNIDDPGTQRVSTWTRTVAGSYLLLTPSQLRLFVRSCRQL